MTVTCGAAVIARLSGVVHRSRRCQAPPEVSEGRVGHIGAKGTNTLSIGYGLGLIELAHFLFSFQPRGLFVGLRVRRATHAKLGHSDRHGCIAQKTAAIVLGCFRHLSPSIHFTVRVGGRCPSCPGFSIQAVMRTAGCYVHSFGWGHGVFSFQSWSRAEGARRGSTEREHKGFDTRIEKLDLDISIRDRLGLPDQLIQPPADTTAVR